MDIQAFASKARQHEVFPSLRRLDPHYDEWHVYSASEAGKFYYVFRNTEGQLRCDCPAGENGRPCIHARLIGICYLRGLNGQAKLDAINAECARGLERAAALVEQLEQAAMAEAHEAAPARPSGEEFFNWVAQLEQERDLLRAENMDLLAELAAAQAEIATLDQKCIELRTQVSTLLAEKAEQDATVIKALSGGRRKLAVATR